MIGWTGEIQGRTLVIYKLQIFKTAPEVTLSITVNEDFTYAVSYRQHNVNREFCILLSGLPSEINTGILLNTLVSCEHFKKSFSVESKGFVGSIVCC